MKLPKHLASRYTQMTDEEMAGDPSAAAYLKQGLSQRGGRPGPVVEVNDDSKALLRPGVLQWNDDGNQVMIKLDRGPGTSKVGSAQNLNLSKILHSRYVQQDIRQGRDVREFPNAPTVKTAKAEAVAQKVMASPVEAAKAKAKAAAKVEAKAKALAAKAEATKKEALAGLGYYFGEEETSESMLKKHRMCIALLAVALGVSLYLHMKKPF